MTSIEEVFKSIEAFVKDMEELGVHVIAKRNEWRVTGGPDVVLSINLFVRKELEEDLEADPRGH